MRTATIGCLSLSYCRDGIRELLIQLFRLALVLTMGWARMAAAAPLDEWTLRVPWATNTLVSSSNEWVWGDPLAFLEEVQFYDGRYIGVGPRELIASSVDLTTWRVKHQADPRVYQAPDLSSIAFGAKALVAVGGRHYSAVPLGLAYLSEGGDVWLPAQAGITMNRVIYGGRLFLGVSALPGFMTPEADGYIQTSPDGKSWDLRFHGTRSIWDVAYGAQRFVAVASPHSTVTSTNGVDWTEHDSPVKFWSIVYGKDRFVASGERTAFSEDGIHWTLTDGIRGAHNDTAVAFGGGLFVAVGPSSIWSSRDGMSWRQRAEPDWGARRISYGGNRFVVVGGTGLWSSAELASFAPGFTFSPAEGSVQLQVTGEPGSSVLLQRSRELLTWEQLGSLTLLTNGIVWTGASEPLAQAFYRLAAPAGAQDGE